MEGTAERSGGVALCGSGAASLPAGVDGTPDPHLHAHCFTFNATYDQVEDKWKAGEFGNIKKDASYFEAYFHSTFAAKLEEHGYGIERNEKGWEISGIERSTRIFRRSP